MALFTSLMHEKFRKNFFVFLFLSSTFPLLLLIFIIYQHVIPVIMPNQINDLKDTFTYGVLVMLLPSFLSFALGSKWIRSIETISGDIKSKSVRFIGEKEELSLIMIDLDDFKQHNDTYGHQTGDKLLKELAYMIRKSIRESDSAFRYGGDEFAVLLPVCDIKNAEHVAQRLVEKVSIHQFKNVEGQRLDKVTISCGVACYKGKLEAFVAEADKHLFAAKTSGKGLVVAQK